MVKVGGRALENNLEGILDSAAKWAREGLVLVHGGGDAVTRMCEKLGVEPRFVVSPEGIRSRYTSMEELEVFTMVIAGLINKRIVAGLAKRGVAAVGLAGADGGVLKARRKKRIVVVDERGRKRVIPGGYTGRITSVNKDLIEMLVRNGYTPVIAPLAIGEEGELLNVDGDQAACRIAEALKASKLVLLSDVDGVLLNGEVVKRIEAGNAEEVASKVGVGMNRKILMAAEAVRNGVGEAIISSGLVEDPIGAALNGSGTVIVP